MHNHSVRVLSPALRAAVEMAVLLLAGCREGAAPRSGPAQIRVESTIPQTAVVHTPIVVSVTILDAHNSLVPGVQVDFAISADVDSLSQSSMMSSASGLATITWFLGGSVGAHSLRISVDGVAPVQLSVSSTPGPPALLSKSAGDDQVSAPGSTVAIAPAVKVSDQWGNPLAGVSVNFTVTGGGGSLASSVGNTDGLGVAKSGAWTLGPSKGFNTISASVAGAPPATFSAIAGLRSPNINVVIDSPPSNALVADQLPIQATVTSANALSSMSASSGASATRLTNAPPYNSWNGTLSLSGMPRDTVTIIVTATDALGAVTDAFVKVLHDRPPTLTVDAPFDGAIATPSVFYSAHCTDDDPAGCVSIKASTDNTILGTGQSTISGTTTLSGPDGSFVHFFFQATDSRGQLAAEERRVFVMSNPHLAVLSSAPGKALDYRGGTLLSLDSGDVQRLIIHHAAGAADEIIPVDSRFSLIKGFLSPAGAIFSEILTGANTSTQQYWLFQLRNGALSSMPGLDFIRSLDVNGVFAAYAASGLHLLDLTSGADIVLSTKLNSDFNLVAANGDVAYQETDNNVYWYHGGTTQRLTADASDVISNSYPITDGINVVYRKGLPCCDPQPMTLIVTDGTTTTVLATGLTSPQPGVAYMVNSGWVAFIKPDINGVQQVWTRSPTGSVQAASAFAAQSTLAALGADGSVLFDTGDKRYYVAPSGTPELIGSCCSPAIWRDGRFVELRAGAAISVTP